MKCEDFGPLQLEHYQMYQEQHFKISFAKNYSCSISPDNSNCAIPGSSPGPIPFKLEIDEMDMIGLVIKYNNDSKVTVKQYMDNVKKSSNGYPLVR